LKRIAILGATGSIGTQALDVIRRNRSAYEVVLLCAHRNVDLLLEQSKEFNPEVVVVTDPDAYAKARKMNFKSRLMYGLDIVNEWINPDHMDLVLNALVGNVGLLSTYTAVLNGVDLALANKESLVTGGEIIMAMVAKNGASILPVDSEHSAIFQCLRGNEQSQLKRIIITASGGPFRGMTHEQISTMPASRALKHPNWTMGRKISIDSATLVNKGLEVMEARWLFNLKPSQIDVVVHPQSIIHSLVEYQDTSIIAQMGNPDMRLPIHYALNYPNRTESGLETFDFMKHPQLTFEKPNLEVFPGLRLAYEAMHAGGTMPTVYNTVNEIMVQKYLSDQISFYEITDAIAREMARHKNNSLTTIEEIISLDNTLRNRLG
jgi:1-deoxy-D-xylulose-5-phosphate reductoisomerase